MIRRISYGRRNRVDLDRFRERLNRFGHVTGYVLVTAKPILTPVEMTKLLCELTLVRCQSLFHLVREKLHLLLGDAGLAVQNYQ
jgi:hypothetical protein